MKQIPARRFSQAGLFRGIRASSKFRPFPVGRNDISLKYVLDKESRAIRIKTLLESVVSTFIKPTWRHEKHSKSPHYKPGRSNLLQHKDRACTYGERFNG